MKNKEELNLDIKVNTNELERTADIMERIGDSMPNIVIRNNECVNLTINNWTNDCDCEESEEE